jgi:hypothetical protein
VFKNKIKKKTFINYEKTSSHLPHSFGSYHSLLQRIHCAQSGIFGIFLSILTYIQTKTEFKNRTFLTLFVTSIFSSLAFAWFGDAISFVAVFISLFIEIQRNLSETKTISIY